MYQLRPFYLETISNNSLIPSKPPTKSRKLRRAALNRRVLIKVPPTITGSASLQISTTSVHILSKTTGKSGREGKKPEVRPLQEKGGGQELNANNTGLIKRLQVSNFETNLDNLKLYLSQQVESFQAGKIRTCYSMWQELTSDPEILDTVKGLNIDFIANPWQGKVPSQKKFSLGESKIIESEINKLLVKGVIIPTTHEPGEFMSTIFLRPKPDGTHRMILNLKKLNESVVY